MAAWRSGGRSSCRAAGLRAATADTAATSSWSPASGTTRWCISGSIPNTRRERGRHGEGSNCTGREGEDVVLKVPVGTIVYDELTGELVHDFAGPDERVVIAQGGRGGRGNARFATSTHQAPREHEQGFPGEERDAAAGVEAAGRCRAGGISECRQVHADFADLGGAAEDCGLSVYDAAAEPGRGGGGRAAG